MTVLRTSLLTPGFIIFLNAYTIEITAIIKNRTYEISIVNYSKVPLFLTPSLEHIAEIDAESVATVRLKIMYLFILFLGGENGFLTIRRRSRHKQSLSKKVSTKKYLNMPRDQ